MYDFKSATEPGVNWVLIFLLFSLFFRELPIQCLIFKYT